jgi:hypothetical protein
LFNPLPPTKRTSLNPIPPHPSQSSDQKPYRHNPPPFSEITIPQPKVSFGKSLGKSNGKYFFRIDAKNFSLAFEGWRVDPYQIIETRGKF